MSANDTQVGGNHYKGKRFQPWDWDKFGIGTFEMDILHYVTRQKAGKQDLEKAVHYVEKLQEEYVRYGRRNRINLMLRSALLAPMKEYCDEWKMVRYQRRIVHTILFWMNEDDLAYLLKELKEYIADAYPDADVRPAGGVDSSKTQ